MNDAPEQLIGIVPMSCSFAPCTELEPLAGRAPLLRAVDAVRSLPGLATMVVAGPGHLQGSVTDLLRAVHQDPEPTSSVRWVTAEASDPLVMLHAVLCVLAPDADDVIVVHDPRQPLVGEAFLSTVVDTLLSSAAPGSTAGLPAAGAIPVRPVTDTLKHIRPDGMITGTPDRARYRVVGSPQVYRASALVSALDLHVGEGTRGAEAGEFAADGPSAPVAAVGLRLAQAVRRAGHRVLTVPAPVESGLVTDTATWTLAGAIASARSVN